ncbi:MAG: type I 3-dehydroquinate dehydratase [bacterium]
MKIDGDKHCLRVGCISTRKGLACLSRKSDCDWAEVRLDALLKDGATLEQVACALTFKTRRKPVLLTLRTKEEGGCYSWKRGERLALFLELLPSADAVDVELASVQELQPVLKEARRLKRKIILSAHALTNDLKPRQVNDLLKKFQRHQADIYKIAVLCREQSDLTVLAQALVGHPSLPLAVMAVGPMANLSRVILPALGSRLVYGYLDKPAAPNQPSIGEVAKQLDCLGVK